MSSRGFSFDKYITIMLFVGIIGVYLNIVFQEARRNFLEFQEERIPNCFEKIPSIIFSNYYDKNCSNLSICRRIEEIILKDCGKNAKVTLESDCGNYYMEGFEDEDNVSVSKRGGIYIYFLELSSNSTDCDYFHLNCSRIFFVKISQSNVSLDIGNFSERICKGEEIKEYFIFRDGMLLKVIEK